MAGRAISPADPCPLPGFGCTANKGPMIIQYKFLVLIYVFPEMNVISKTEL
jgi:hypothetical protein